MTKFEFTGTYSALITPFLENGNIDFISLEKIIEHQIINGISGIVVGGSTGENFSLTIDEKRELYSKSIQIANKRCKVIVGTGSNDTLTSCNMSKMALELGADAALLVAPYYNKPSQHGLYSHYKLIADEVKELPLIIYNVPGRTAVNILPSTVKKLSNDCPNIVAVKEASGDLDQMMEIMKNSSPEFGLLSGDDSLTLPIILMGGKGVISVISNYIPKEFSEMVNLALEGNYSKAKDIHYKFLELMNLNFIESNPTPVKYIMHRLGFCNEVYRMPLMPIKNESKIEIDNELLKIGLLK